MFSLQKTNTDCYVPLSVKPRVCDTIQQPMCKFRDKCLYKSTCIYAHPTGQERPQVCIYHLSNNCKFGTECHFQHIDDVAEQNRIRFKLSNTDCFYGNSCPRVSHCLFRHRRHLRTQHVIIKTDNKKQRK